jgi:hypothetical protein
MNDSELLGVRVRAANERVRKFQKERYQLARSLGFSGVEAAILQNWNEERIRALAESKKKGF